MADGRGVVERESTSNEEEERREEEEDLNAIAVVKIATACHERDRFPSLLSKVLSSLLHQADDPRSCGQRLAIVATQKSHLDFLCFLPNTSSLFFSIAKKRVWGASRKSAPLRS